MLQDAHIHLQDAGEQARRILTAAAESGVGRFFCNAAALSDWEEVGALARDFESVVPFFGIHPWYAGGAPDGWDARLKERLQDKASRVGEIGLDKARRTVNFEKQTEIFRKQLDIAVQTKKPFAVHCVLAWETLIAELAGHVAGRVPFIVHWFSGSPEMALELVKAGGYISFSTRLLDKGAQKHRASFDRVPIDRILLETDYPYMPDVKKGQIPGAEEYFAALTALYECASRLKGISADELARKVWNNGTVFAR